MGNKNHQKHNIEGYTIDPFRIEKNFDRFIQAMGKVKKLLPTKPEMRAKEFTNMFWMLKLYVAVDVVF